MIPGSAYVSILSEAAQREVHGLPRELTPEQQAWVKRRQGVAGPWDPERVRYLPYRNESREYPKGMSKKDRKRLRRGENA